jgi:hypothetical protein
VCELSEPTDCLEEVRIPHTQFTAKFAKALLDQLLAAKIFAVLPYRIAPLLCLGGAPLLQIEIESAAIMGCTQAKSALKQNGTQKTGIQI